MRVTGDFLFRMGMPETCLGKPVEAHKEYYYSDGCVFEHIDDTTKLDIEEQACKEYMQLHRGMQIPSAMDDIYDEEAACTDMIRDVLEEIQIYRRRVLKA